MEKPTFEKTEEIKDPILMYLSEKHKTLIHDYRTPDARYAESCALIAADIAKMLLQNGKQPEIISVSGKNESLKPLLYEGRVTWGAHVVCLCDGLVYDPMIGRVVPLEEYTQKAFGADAEVEVRTVVTKDGIEEFVGR